ncbi:MAG: deoxyuridine 5'-triphosphate nucleotidohydrolase [Acidobacterium ailaaui]|nr:deoxyuridine 5'-triphosphate nucleotidohydrolase [Pseudacidobacterium ailaaui]
MSKLDDLLAKCTPEKRHDSILDCIPPSSLSVKIKRIHPDAVIPQYAKPGDAGFDLVAVEDVIVEPGETVKVPTGLAFELPEGYELQIRPRSGITLKTKLRVQLGTVDAGYRGEVGVIVDNVAQPEHSVIDGELWYDSTFITRDLNGNEYDLPDELADEVLPVLKNSVVIPKGTRIAQCVIAPIQQAEFIEVDELSKSERGAGGFGSTGVSTNDDKEAE